MADIKITFEDAMKRIEEIVSMLENGNTSLDESIELFEEATKLCAFCNERLETAEQKIKSLSISSEEK